ncbi:MAG: ABC-type transport auxiliary lipoprotein family protein [Candidatus Aureabacteria bacterium]|nr:ABC-type transport auxiliary lipoprotein family protein [Candidatus Auribacterota bacterium]
MRSLVKVLMLFPLLTVIVSCSTYMQTHYYVMNTEPDVPQAGATLPLRVGVNDVRAPSRYQDQMFYRTPDYQAGFYEYSHWVEPPAEMVKKALLHSLKASGLFQRVESLGVGARPELVLQAGIDSFDQLVTKEGLFAECALTLNLGRSDNGELVWTHESRVRVKQDGKGQFVAAMNEAMGKAIREAVTDMEGSEALREMAQEIAPNEE